MAAAPAHVLAVIVTCRRNPLLRRALDSMHAEAPLRPDGIVVVDNAADPACRELVRSYPLVCEYIAQERNPGHGAGQASGLRAAAGVPVATHFLLMDDDAIAQPAMLRELVEGMASSQAAAVVPLVEDAAGFLGWYPGPLDRRRWELIRRAGMTPSHFRREAGDNPAPFAWAPWCILLLSRAALENVGLPRSDFGFMGDDIEYTLRITHRYRAMLIPAAIGRHLPPGRRSPAESYYIDCLFLQNLTFIASRLPHGRRLLRHLPGRFRDFHRRWGWSPPTMGIALLAFGRGMIRGRPAGTRGADGFHRRWLEARLA